MAAATVVAEAGSVLVAAAPAGPVQDVSGFVSDGVDDLGKQAADFVHAQSYQVAIVSPSSPVVTRSAVRWAAAAMARVMCRYQAR